MKKVLTISILLLFGIPVAELAREEASYLLHTRTLKNASAQIIPDMTEDEVRELAGNPDSTKDAEQGESWYRSSDVHQGRLWGLLGLVWVKGHQTLAVKFDSRKRVVRIWGGVN